MHVCVIELNWFNSLNSLVVKLAKAMLVRGGC